MSLLEVADLRVTFATRRGAVRAVDGVSFTLDEGETLGLVGESGSGKSVTSLALLDLLPRDVAHVEARRLEFGGRDLSTLPPRERRALRGREMSMVFQDPLSSLNPYLTIGRQLGEVVELHQNATRRAARQASERALVEVGIPSAAERLDAFPHELSGGMRQRVLIAMALLCRPRLLVADEPTTALDVTVQAQILDLLRALQHEHGTAIVLVTHSLGVVAGMCERVAVMYCGRIVEEAAVDALFASPRHPYTRGLLASVPRLDSDPSARLASIGGAPPDPARRPAGCAFAPRCAHAFERCTRDDPVLRASLTLPPNAQRDAPTTLDELLYRPPLEPLGRESRSAACFLVDEGRS